MAKSAAREATFFVVLLFSFLRSFFPSDGRTAFCSEQTSPNPLPPFSRFLEGCFFFSSPPGIDESGELSRRIEVCRCFSSLFPFPPLLSVVEGKTPRLENGDGFFESAPSFFPLRQPLFSKIGQLSFFRNSWRLTLLSKSLFS